MARRTKTTSPPAGRTLRGRRKRAPVKAARTPEHDASESFEDAERKAERRASRGTDAMSRYMRDVEDAGPLLTPAEEHALGREMAERAIAQILQRLQVAEAILKPKLRKAHPGLVPMAEAFIAEFNPKRLEGKRLATRLHDIVFDGAAGSEILMRYLACDKTGMAVIDRFVKSNLRLVINIAKRYGNSMLPLPELIQEGNLGLMHAVPRFDYRRKLRFSTYATWWIRHAIGRAIADKGRTVRLPVHLIEAAHKTGKARNELTSELGRPPTEAELAKRTKTDVDKLDKIRRWTMLPVSLDEPVNEEREDPLGSFIADEPPEPEAWASLIPGKEFELLKRALDGLDGIDADVLRLRYGFDDEEERTLKEIGEKYRLSRERIRQLEVRGLKRLRLALKRELMAGVT